MVRMSLVSCLQVSGDNGEVWGGYGGRVRSVALATTRGCPAFHPLVPEVNAFRELGSSVYSLETF